MQKPQLANTVVAPIASTETPGTAGYFTDGVPPGTGPTEIGADFLNAVTVELAAAATRDGEIALDTVGVFSKQIFNAIKGAYALASLTGAAAMGAVTTAWTRLVAASHLSESNGTYTAIIGCDDVTIDAAAVCVTAESSVTCNMGSTAARSAAIASICADIGGVGNAAIASGLLSGGQDVLDGANSALIACADSTSAAPIENHGTRCVIMASDRGVIAADCVEGAIIASTTGTLAASVGNPFSNALVGTTGSTITNGGVCGISASVDCAITGVFQSFIAASDTCSISVSNGVLLASSDAILTRANSVAGGNPAIAATGVSGTNLAWRLDSDTGDITGAGTVATGNANADYAELFENLTDGVLPVGALIARDGQRVRLAKTGDRIVGVVSAAPAILGNAAELHWTGAHVRDEWGTRVLTKRDDGATVAVASDAVDPTRAYVPRRERPAQWTAVGLVGQLRVRVDATVGVGDDVCSSDTAGIGTAGQGDYRGAHPECMAITSPFDAARGYGIALCLVR